jgi:hypothetical protein
MIITAANHPASCELELLALGYLMIPFMIIMIAHAAIIRFGLSTRRGGGFRRFLLHLLSIIDFFFCRDGLSIKLKCARSMKFLNGMSSQPSLGLKGSCISLKLTRRVVIIDIGLLSVSPGGSRIVDIS